MILLIVKNRISFVNPKNAAFSCIVHFYSSSAAFKIQNPYPKPNIMVEFLRNSCGLSSQKAASASKVISKATSIKQADSVRHFFKQLGFDDTHIRKVISNYPYILSANVEKTIKPNLQTLSNLGFDEAELQALISTNPFIVVNPLAIPRLQFWETFLRTDGKKGLVKVFMRNRGLLGHDIVSGITPKISLFKKHGFSDSDIANLVKKGRCLMSRSSKTLEALLKRTEEIGFDIKSSLMILQGVSSLASIGRSAFAKKMEFFKGFGWSEREFLDAFKKAPYVIHLKEENIQAKMEFLAGRVGCKQSYIASHPLLLAFSLEKRLKPRHYVMEILKTKKLVSRDLDNFTIMCLGEKRFVEKLIVKYEKQVPDIHEIYVAACAGQINFE